ncbi:MAG: hypothetical protein Ct9H300mP1_13620 [Planctomycetaceae bacterium]|nr:MAG: hypothetical protein Ct9H300mP1_13620 [Planctomycetaceae bacterium]
MTRPARNTAKPNQAPTTGQQQEADQGPPPSSPLARGRRNRPNVPGRRRGHNHPDSHTQPGDRPQQVQPPLNRLTRGASTVPAWGFSPGGGKPQGLTSGGNLEVDRKPTGNVGVTLLVGTSHEKRLSGPGPLAILFGCKRLSGQQSHRVVLLRLIRHLLLNLLLLDNFLLFLFGGPVQAGNLAETLLAATLSEFTCGQLSAAAPFGALFPFGNTFPAAGQAGPPST